MIDFHSHILPKMDDGSRSSEESVNMLRTSADYGVTAIVATPHFYGYQEYPDSFLERREACFARLKEVCKDEEGLPEVFTGAEILMFSGVSGMDELERLSINGTRYVLIEMPFEPWSDWAFRELNAIISRGMRPIIAHVERYIKLQKGTDNISRLLGMDVLIQSNAEAYLDGFGSRKMLRMMADGNIHLLGSDCHNLTSRPPNIGQALEVISKKCGQEVIDRINGRAERILYSEQNLK